MNNDFDLNMRDVYETIHLCEKELSLFIQGRIQDMGFEVQ